MAESSVLTLAAWSKTKEAIGPVVAFDESQPLICGNGGNSRMRLAERLADRGY
jgi:hypothetical protein